jgi:hypothetical protein
LRINIGLNNISTVTVIGLKQTKAFVSIDKHKIKLFSSD